MSCELLQAKLEVFLDGELSAEETLQLQSHTERCGDCQQAMVLSRTIRRTTRELVRTEQCASVDLEQRLSEALALAELEERQGSRPHSGERGRARRWLARGAPLAAAAALGLLIGNRPWRSLSAPEPVVQGPTTGTLVPGSDLLIESNEPMIESVVARHVSSAPPQFMDRRQFGNVEQLVGVRLPQPDRLQGAAWEGAGVVRVRHQPAAQLSYRYPGGRRISAYVFDPSRVPLHAELSPRQIPGTDNYIYVGRHRGYPIAAFLRDGVGYAVTGDLDERESAELVRAIAAFGHSSSP